MREHSREAGLIGEHVDQSPADYDGVTHAEGFERRREQHACAHRTGQVDVVSDFQIVNDGLKNVVDVAFGREQAGAGEALDDVVFRLLLPFALSLQRRSVLRGGGFIFHAVDANLREFVVLVALLEVVAPDAGLGLEGQLVLHTRAEVAFFAVNVGGNPVTGNQVQTPAIHVEEVGIPRRRSIGSVEPDDVEVLVFDPDTTEEAASLAGALGVLLGCDVKYETTDVAEKFAADVMKLIVRAVKVRTIGIDHPGEAGGLVLDLVELVEAAQQSRLHTLKADAPILVFQIVFAVDLHTHIHAAEE